MFPFPNIIGSSALAFNPADKAANVAVSNNNKTIGTSSGFGDDACRSVTSHAAGQWHAEFTVTDNQPWQHAQLGIANASAPLTGPQTSLQSTPHACVLDVASGGSNVYNNNSGTPLGGNTEAFAYPVTFAIETDLGPRQFYFQRVGGARTGPFTFAAISGPIFLIGGLYVSAQTITLNTGAAAFAVTPTSGFNAWG